MILSSQKGKNSISTAIPLKMPNYTYETYITWTKEEIFRGCEQRDWHNLRELWIVAINALSYSVNWSSKMPI